MLIKIEGSSFRLREFNKFVDEFNEQNHVDENGKQIIADKISNIDEVFIPYKTWLDSIQNENLKIIDDTETDFTGVYVTYDANTHLTLPQFTDYIVDNSHDEIITPLFGRDYGVCDNASQVLDLFRSIEKHSTEGIAKEQMDGEFIIRLMPVIKNDNNGWRWHKWGSYIGIQNPKCEYIDDEDDIDMVYAFHIYRLKKSI